MFNGHFYHAKYRKAVAVFGTIFNNITVIRKDASGATMSQIKVPLSFSPKRKFIERLSQNKDLLEDTKTAIRLPRMGFEVLGLNYDPPRQLPRVNAFPMFGDSDSVKKKVYVGTPYSMQFSLGVYAKTIDDAMQIIEQILPYFAPNYSMTIKPYAEYPKFMEDVTISLQSVSQDDTYQGSLENRRTIIFDLNFEMKVMFHGPLESGKIVQKVINKFYFMNEGLKDSDVFVEKHTLTTNPAQVSPDSAYSWVNSWSFSVDSA